MLTAIARVVHKTSCMSVCACWRPCPRRKLESVNLAKCIPSLTTGAQTDTTGPVSGDHQSRARLCKSSSSFVPTHSSPRSLPQWTPSHIWSTDSSLIVQSLFSASNASVMTENATLWSSPSPVPEFTPRRVADGKHVGRARCGYRSWKKIIRGCGQW